MDKYLVEEVGQRREITSSMVARAVQKREENTYHALLRRMYQNMSPAPASLHGYGIGSLFPNRCPYCGR